MDYETNLIEMYGFAVRHGDAASAESVAEEYKQVYHKDISEEWNAKRRKGRENTKDKQ